MNYQAEITVPVTRIIAYTAIAEDMSIWWTEMSARFLKIGDKAKTDFGGESYWVFEAITLDEPKLVELRCCESNHIHEGMSSDIKEEWLDEWSSLWNFNVYYYGTVRFPLIGYCSLEN